MTVQLVRRPGSDSGFFIFIGRHFVELLIYLSHVCSENQRQRKDS